MLPNPSREFEGAGTPDYSQDYEENFMGYIEGRGGGGTSIHIMYLYKSNCWLYSYKDINVDLCITDSGATLSCMDHHQGMRISMLQDS